VSCAAVNESCASIACCAGADLSHVNDGDNSLCRQQCDGASCDQGFSCQDAVCLPDTTYLEDGEECEFGSDCYSNFCSPESGFCESCRTESETCRQTNGILLTCREGLVCGSGGTCEVACLEIDSACSAGGECCSGQCTQGVYAEFCQEEGNECLSDADCCDKLICSEYFCAIQGGESSGAGTLTIHVASGPTGVGPGIFDPSHDNVVSGVTFTVTDSGEVQL
jgi:hypothetical protein